MCRVILLIVGQFLSVFHIQQGHFQLWLNLKCIVCCCFIFELWRNKPCSWSIRNIKKYSIFYWLINTPFQIWIYIVIHSTYHIRLKVCSTDSAVTLIWKQRKVQWFEWKYNTVCHSILKDIYFRIICNIQAVFNFI